MLAACTAPVPETVPEPEPTVSVTDTAPSAPVDTSPPEKKTPPCEHPVSFDTSMGQGALLEPFGWKVARHLDGREAPLFMERVFCNDDPDIDWSPFDVLVFVAIPAW